MHCKRPFAALAAMVLLVAASGCGGEGPVSSEKSADGNNNNNPGSTAPSKLGGSESNLKRIGHAFHDYAATFTSAFPPAASGKPPCSWRVKLLPYLGEVALYKQYRMSEPWDSPQNLEVAKTTPKIYQTPGRPDDGKTCFVVFRGKETALDGPRAVGSPNVPLWSIQDGMQSTILCVGVGPDKAVPWSKPEDVPFDPVNPQAALGQIPDEGFLAATCDGRVHLLKVDNATLKALITPSGGEKIDMSKIGGGR